jgi:hypothetical protein
MTTVQEAKLVSNEFSNCNFNDKRLCERGMKIADSMFSRPGSIIWSSFNNNAERKATYNFFKNPKVNMSKIQEPHFVNTMEQIKSSSRAVLIIHDTTYCSFKDGKAFEDCKGYLYKNKKAESTQGFAVQSSLAVCSNGIPIGLASQSIYQHYEKEVDHKKLPIEEKESNRWLSGLRVLDPHLSNQDNVVHIMDREGDIFEVLSCAYQEGRRIIIRQSHDRITGENYRESQGFITERLSSLEWTFRHELDIYDSNESKYIKRTFGIRKLEITLPVPKDKKFSKEINLKKPLKVNVVEVCSLDDLPEIRWVLFTNMPIETEEEVLTVVQYYRYRWHIENYHKVLKSGFKVEEARLESLEGIKNLISFLSILSVRLYYLIHLSRVEGSQSCESVLQRHEWEALCIHRGMVNFENRKNAKPPTINEAIIMIAQLGGYMNRKRDAPPGIIVIWRGWSRLHEMASYHKIITNTNKTYG